MAWHKILGAVLPSMPNTVAVSVNCVRHLNCYEAMCGKTCGRDVRERSVDESVTMGLPC